MMRREAASIACLLALGLLLTAVPSPAAVQSWVAAEATVTLALDDALLASHGLKLAQSRSTARIPAGREQLSTSITCACWVVRLRQRPHRS